MAGTTAPGPAHGRAHLARRLAQVPNPAELLYGAVVAASVLATASAHTEDFKNIALAVCLVLVVYWSAHVYVEAQSMQLRGDARHLLRLLGHTAGHEAAVIAGGFPAVLVFVLADVLGASASRAAVIAVWFSLLVLFCVGLLTAHAAGRRGLPALVDACLAGLVGVLVIVAKMLLH